MMFGWFFSGGEETVNHRIRIIVLCGLCFQNSSHALLRRYSQVTQNVPTIDLAVMWYCRPFWKRNIRALK